MNVYLHAGMHKTGTTSLQHVLQAHTAELAALGYRAFVTPRQIVVKYVDRFDAAWIREQLAAAKADGLLSVIISAEGLSTFDRTRMRQLLACFSGHPVTIVLVFRHWNTFLPSRWKQNCLRRDTQPFPVYLHQLEQHADDHIDANYSQVIRNMLVSADSRLRVLSYDHATRQGRLLFTLLRAFDIPAAAAEQFAATNPMAHPSGDTRFYEICRLLNGIWSQHNGQEPDALYRRFRDYGCVDEVYDFAELSGAFADKEPAATRELHARLNTQTVDVRLDATRFAPWAARAAVARPYLLNPIDNQLFANIPANTFTCSTLQVADLPAALQSLMTDFIRQQLSQ